MKKNEKSKSILLAILLVSLIALSIAYAILSQNLYINSQTIIAGQSSGWDIRFTAATCHATGSAGIQHDFVMNATVLDGLIARFNAPGDSVVCDIKVTNNGIINAKLSTYAFQDGTISYLGSGTNKTADETLVTNKVHHNIVYGTGDPQAGLTPAPNDTLPSGVTRDLVLTITYTGTDLPDNDVVVSGLKSTFLYMQN